MNGSEEEDKEGVGGAIMLRGQGKRATSSVPLQPPRDAPLPQPMMAVAADDVDSSRTRGKIAALGDVPRQRAAAWATDEEERGELLSC